MTRVTENLFRRPIYRMYLDEVGHSNYHCDLNHENNRFLSVTGVIVSLDYVDQVLSVQMEELKKTYFKPPHHPDSPVILHRKEIKGKRHPFRTLLDQDIQSSFDNDLLSLLSSWDYRVVTVTVDKEAMSHKYVQPRDAYEYCMEILLEKFVFFLSHHGSEGDMMVETRQSRENRSLRRAYTNLYENGTRFLNADEIKARITTKDVKIKEKALNIAGLQLADLLAFPAFGNHAHHQVGRSNPPAFCRRIIEIIVKQKYERNPSNGSIEGYGLKWFP